MEGFLVHTPIKPINNFFSGGCHRTTPREQKYSTMRFDSVALSILVSIGGTDAFSPPATGSIAFVGRTQNAVSIYTHLGGYSHPSCKPVKCNCPSCRGGVSPLFADVAEEASEGEAAAAEAPVEVTSEAEAPVEATSEGEAPADDVEVPPEVEAMDGIESPEEAHNVERPARAQIKKKKVPQGKELSEFEVGSTVAGRIKTIASYGAFVDFGARTDGLLHISNLASGFVSSVEEIVKEGQEVEVRIISIDTAKGQVGLSMISEEEEAENKAQNNQKRERPQRRQNNRRDDSAVLSALQEKGWDTELMVEGTVISTVDFGCFVRVDSSALNSECEGEFDGLVHISALRSGRVSSVTDVVNADDKVQVRVKAINGSKVSLTMLTAEEDANKAESRGSAPSPGDQGAKDWKESLDKFDADENPAFENQPMIVDLRK